jgi:hypothetical protein
MSTADKVYELVKTFSEEQAQLVLKFAQVVQQRGHQTKTDSEEQASEDIQSWQALVQALAGAWADFLSAEELRANLGQDLVRESFDCASSKKTLEDFVGILKDSPNFNEDPVEIQRRMRNW